MGVRSDNRLDNIRNECTRRSLGVPSAGIAGIIGWYGVCGQVERMKNYVTSNRDDEEDMDGGSDRESGRSKKEWIEGY